MFLARTLTGRAAFAASAHARALRRAAPWRGVSSTPYVEKDWPDHELLPLAALSPTMEKGGVANWVKQEGDAIAAGDVVLELETDKATLDFEAQDDSYLAKILVPAGTSDLAVGTALAVLVEDESDVAAFADATPADFAGSDPEPEVVATPKVEDVSGAQATSAETYAAATMPSPKRLPRIQFRHGDRSKIASSMGFSGSQEERAPVATAQGAGTTATPPPADPRGSVDIPLTAMRKVIAARLTESKATIPHYYSRMECSIDNMLAFRKTLKAAGVNVSVNDLVIVAAALALRDVPEANSFWNGSSIEQNDTVDISVAVATEGGLITPIVKDADKIGLSAVNKNVGDLALRARKGGLAPEEYTGGSFTISNLGMFGISEFTAVINPPQACILAVGGGMPRPKCNTPGVLEKETVMTVSLSADRRVVDDHVAAQFLQVFRAYCEQPSLMSA